MQLVRLEGSARLGWPKPAVTVGNFDGLHLGHQALVAKVVEAARAGAGTAVVLSFDPHPSRVLSPGRAPSALMTLAQKQEILAELGVERLVILPFTAETARRGPEEFARDVLGRILGARLVVVGSRFRFGHKRRGDIALLRRLGSELGFGIVAVDPVLIEGAPISSSRVREALVRGAVAAARALLGRAFFVDGIVVRGDGRGRSLGIPTANLRPENETLPRSGVYVGRCRIPEGRAVPCVINVGERPTFGGGRITLEAHLIDFAADLYDARLRVEFYERLRDERRFAGPEALVEQIRADIAEARGVLEKG